MKRDILTISAALMLVAVLFVPAMGYSIENGSPYPFSAKAESRPQFSIGMGTPAHNITFDSIVVEKPARYSIAMGKPYQYTLQTGKPYQYSFVLGSAIPTVAAQPMETLPASGTEGVTTEGAATTEGTAETKVSETETPAPPAPTFNISGVVFEDMDGNGIMEANETGLPGWMVNLEGISNTTTGADGYYSFTGLAAGEYTLSLNMMEGYQVPAPMMVNITDADVQRDFPVTLIPKPPEAMVTAPVTGAVVENTVSQTPAVVGTQPA